MEFNREFGKGLWSGIQRSSERLDDPFTKVLKRRKSGEVEGHGRNEMPLKLLLVVSLGESKKETVRILRWEGGKRTW